MSKILYLFFQEIPQNSYLIDNERFIEKYYILNQMTFTYKPFDNRQPKRHRKMSFKKYP